MIKAKKGLLITLFAAMMVFAFGATSAFAADDPVWSSDYSTVTIEGHTFNTDRTYDEGAITAVPKATELADVDLEGNYADLSKTYYDLSNAAFAINGAAVKSSYLNGNYTKGSVNGLIFNVPSYVKDASSATATSKTFEELNVATWQGKATGDDEFDKTLATEQTFTLSLKISYVQSDTEALNFIGSVPAKAVTVQARKANNTDVKFYKDEVSATAEPEATGAEDATKVIEFPYDGVAHKIVSNSVAGLTVSWEQFNTATGKWDAVSECPAVTNVADTESVRAVVSWTTTNTNGDTTSTTTNKVTVTFNLSVTNAAALPTFGFDGNGDIPSQEVIPAGVNKEYGYTVVAGTTYDATEWIVATNDNAKAAVKANAAELKEFFGDFYTIKTTTKAAYPDVEFLEIAAKTDNDIDAAAFKTLKTKYATLLKNFGKSNAANVAALGLRVTAGANKAYVYTTAAADSAVFTKEIEFTTSPSVVTYKGKKTTKAGKLKKAQSFTVKAEADNGATVNYKLINANSKIKINKTTGKITVKKGLTKGTYKIKVKAYNAGTYETQAITIKIKK